MRTTLFRLALAAAVALSAPHILAATYGAPMPEGDATPIAALFPSYAPAHTGHSMKFSGRITQVCQNKGCWVMLDAGGTGVRVMTKHAFFLPKDASGTAIVFGELKPVELTTDQATHYNEESGGGVEAGREWQILATSIVIQP